MHELTARYKDTPGKIGVRLMHDPVYKTVLEPSGRDRNGLHRLSTSCGTYQLDGTGYGSMGEKRIGPENSEMLNAVVGPLLSTPDTVYKFRPVKVGKKPGERSGTWLSFADRVPLDAA